MVVITEVAGGAEITKGGHVAVIGQKAGPGGKLPLRRKVAESSTDNEEETAIREGEINTKGHGGRDLTVGQGSV